MTIDHKTKSKLENCVENSFRWIFAGVGLDLMAIIHTSYRDVLFLELQSQSINFPILIINSSELINRINIRFLADICHWNRDHEMWTMDRTKNGHVTKFILWLWALLYPRHQSQ